MAIFIKCAFQNKEEMLSAKTKAHKALVGSPGYINSEIAIVDGDLDSEFILIIGHDNEDDLICRTPIRGSQSFYKLDELGDV